MSLAIWLLLLLPLVLGLGTSRLVRREFARYGGIANHSGATGAQVARVLLDAQGLTRVAIEPAPGSLTDYYDGQARVLHLSAPVADERSVAAMGIAAHEVEHAYQDAEGSRAYRARKSVGEPLSRFAPWSGLALIGGFWLGIPVLIVLSLAYIAGLVVFALVTLPVEIGASRRAVAVLHSTGLASDEESREVRRVLGAAALTYVGGLLGQIGTFAAFVFIAEGIRRAAGGG
jgi:Zn-dependent membrane protease YugP